MIAGAFDSWIPADASAERLEGLAEAAVMALVLTEHPAQLTEDEVIRALGNGGLSALALGDAADRLHRSGLVHREGGFIVPSRAALRLDRLPIAEAKRALPSVPG